MVIILLFWHLVESNICRISQRLGRCLWEKCSQEVSTPKLSASFVGKTRLCWVISPRNLQWL